MCVCVCSVAALAGKPFPDLWFCLSRAVLQWQNAISQAKLFKRAVDITGIFLAKLDGTAKGGVILGMRKEVDIPVKYVGLGEGVDDIQEFDADKFVDALFD